MSYCNSVEASSQFWKLYITERNECLSIGMQILSRPREVQLAFSWIWKSLVLSRHVYSFQHSFILYVFVLLWLLLSTNFNISAVPSSWVDSIFNTCSLFHLSENHDFMLFIFFPNYLVTVINLALEQHDRNFCFVVSFLWAEGPPLPDPIPHLQPASVQPQTGSELTTDVMLGTGPGKSYPWLKLSNAMACLWFHVKQNICWWYLRDQMI